MGILDIIQQLLGAAQGGQEEPAVSAPIGPPVPPAPQGFQPADQREADILAKLHPAFRPRVQLTLQKARQAGLVVYVFEGLRTIERQNELYAKGRDANGIIIDKSKVVTNAKGGTSYHNYSAAVDLVFDGDLTKPGVQWTWNEPSALWKQLGAIGQSCGLDWAGTWVAFKEVCHFQIKTPGVGWRDLLAAYNKGGMAEAWSLIDSVAT